MHSLVAMDYKLAEGYTLAVGYKLVSGLAQHMKAVALVLKVSLAALLKAKCPNKTNFRGSHEFVDLLPVCDSTRRTTMIHL